MTLWHLKDRNAYFTFKLHIITLVLHASYHLPTIWISYLHSLVAAYLTYPHLRMAAPQLNPAPKPAHAIMSPFLTWPERTASSKASGMEAALVLP